MENLTAHKGTIRYLGSSLSPDDKTLLLSSDAKGGYMNVALLDVATKLGPPRWGWLCDAETLSEFDGVVQPRTWCS